MSKDVRLLWFSALLQCKKHKSRKHKQTFTVFCNLLSCFSLRFCHWGGWLGFVANAFLFWQNGNIFTVFLKVSFI